MVNMEITRVVASLLRGMECLTLLILGLSLSVYSDKIKEYVMPSETCGYIVESGDQFKLSSANVIPPDITGSDTAPYVQSYEANVDCEITFRTTGNKKIYVRITHFEIENSAQCQNDVLKLYDSPSSGERTMVNGQAPSGLCGLTLSLPNYFYSKGSDITIKFKTNDNDNSYSGFVMLLTPYRVPPEGGNCTEEETTCRLSGKCFTGDAYCNQENQCEDGSDEPGVAVCRKWRNGGKRNQGRGGHNSSSRLCGSHIVGLFVALLTTYTTYIFTSTDQFNRINRPSHSRI